MKTDGLTFAATDLFEHISSLFLKASIIRTVQTQSTMIVRLLYGTSAQVAT